jgi:hypothetical protein
VKFSRACIDAVAPGTCVFFLIRVVHGYPVALAICKKELYSTALITPFGTWFKTWEASSAGKAWHDENEKKSHHFFSFKLDKVRINNNAPVRNLLLAFQQP